MLNSANAIKLQEETIEDFLTNRISKEELIKRLKLLIYRAKIHEVEYYLNLSKIVDSNLKSELETQIIGHSEKIKFKSDYTYDDIFDRDYSTSWNDDL